MSKCQLCIVVEGSGKTPSNKHSCTRCRPYQESLLTYVEVDVFPSFMCDKSTEISSGDAMPDSLISFFEGALHVRSN